MTDTQRQQITDRFALKLAEIIRRNRHHPCGADIEALLERSKALGERNT